MWLPPTAKASIPLDQETGCTAGPSEENSLQEWPSVMFCLLSVFTQKNRVVTPARLLRGSGAKQWYMPCNNTGCMLSVHVTGSRGGAEPNGGIRSIIPQCVRAGCM